MALADDTRRRFFILGGILLVTGLAFDAQQIVPANADLPTDDAWRITWTLIDLAITVAGGGLFLTAYVSYLESSHGPKRATKP